MRLFIAVELPGKVKKYFSEIQSSIDEKLGGFTMVEPELAHINLKFLGDCSEKNHVVEALKTVKFNPFKLKTSNIGFFPNKNYARVVWLGFENFEELADLQKKVDKALEKKYPPEKNFKPHATLARVKSISPTKRIKLIEWAGNFDAKEIEFVVSSFKLYKSVLTPKGPEYTKLFEK